VLYVKCQDHGAKVVDYVICFLRNLRFSLWWRFKSRSSAL